MRSVDSRNLASLPGSVPGWRGLEEAGIEVEIAGIKVSEDAGIEVGVKVSEVDAGIEVGVKIAGRKQENP